MTFGLRPVFVIVALCASAMLVAPASAAGDAAVETRLSSRGIRDPRVLEAFARVPREAYVPENAPERRYDDRPLPGNFVQVISQPYLLARMIEALRLKPDARVLEIGTGTGYAAALLAELAGEVFSVGVIPESAAAARLRLAREGYQNVHVKLGDVAAGWREYGPYDAVIVTSIGPRVPPTLIDQVTEGGVLVMAVGPPRGRQVLLRGVKKGFKLHAKELAELQAAPSGGPTRKSGESGDVTEKRRPRNPDDSRSDR